MAQEVPLEEHQKPRFLENSPEDGARNSSAEMPLEHVSPSPQAADQLPPVKRLVLLAEQTYNGIEQQLIPPLDTTLAKMSHASTWDIPCPRFKQWTADEASLEFMPRCLRPLQL